MCVQGHPCVIEWWDGASGSILVVLCCLDTMLQSPFLRGYFKPLKKIIFSCEEFVWYVCACTLFLNILSVSHFLKVDLVKLFMKKTKVL